MKASSTKLRLTSKGRDKYFILINGDVGIVDMMHEEGDITCRIVKKRWLKSFFQGPDDSVKYFIYLMTLNSVNILTATLPKEDYTARRFTFLLVTIILLFFPYFMSHCSSLR